MYNSQQVEAKTTWNDSLKSLSQVQGYAER